ncbi:MAG: hypothetical protein RIK87_06500 [Fuerstiella sp.]
MTLTFEPLLPPIVWVSLAVLAMALWVWYAWSRPEACSRWLWRMILVLTAGGLAAVLTVLLNPIWLKPLPPPAGKPLLTILVDSSASMATSDTGAGTTRFRQAGAATTALAADLRQQFDIRIQTFAQETRPVDVTQLGEMTPDGSVTDLSSPLLDAMVSDRPQGQAVLMISDGVHNAAGHADRALEAAATAKAWDAPVYTTTLGADVLVSDLEVRVPRSQELAFVGQSVPVIVELRQHGVLGDRVNVTLTDASGQETTQQARLNPNAMATTSFLVTPPETGLFQYQIRAASLPGEATTANNASTFQVRVVDKPVRALVLEGKPYWDAKFLLRMLTDDPSLEVDCIVRVSAERFLWRKLTLVDSVGTTVSDGNPVDADSGAGDTNSPDAADGRSPDSANADPDASPDTSESPRFQRQEEMEFTDTVATVLRDRKRLRDYQILLLGREAETYLSDAAVENIRSWIAQDGGSLVCYRGSPVAEPSQKLSRLLPVSWATGRDAAKNEERFRIQVTERGDDLSWLRIGGPEGLTGLPSLAPSGATESIRPLAIVLGRRDSSRGTSPVLTYQPYGTGRVVVVEGSGMWRWAFLAPEYRAMDAAYGTMWQSLLRWLISSGGLLPGEDTALQMDRVSFTEGESMSAVVLRRPELDNAELPPVTLMDDAGRLLQSVQPIPVGEELGVYQVFFGSLPVGHYQAQLSTEQSGATNTRTVHFDVQPDLREKLEVSARPDLMGRIAEISGGESIAVDQLSSLGSRIRTHLQESRPVQYQRQTAWDRWWVLGTILVVWSVTWGLRRRTGLV